MSDQMEKFRAELGNRIREARVAKNMTQGELAHATGYSDENGKSIISKIENGKVEPPISKLLTFATALDTSVMELMGWPDVKRIDPKDTYAMADLTEQETMLLVMFRQLNNAGKQATMSMVNGMVVSKEFTGEFK